MGSYRGPDKAQLTSAQLTSSFVSMSLQGMGGISRDHVMVTSAAIGVPLFEGFEEEGDGVKGKTNFKNPLKKDSQYSLVLAFGGGGGGYNNEHGDWRIGVIIEEPIKEDPEEVVMNGPNQEVYRRNKGGRRGREEREKGERRERRERQR